MSESLQHRPSVPFAATIEDEVMTNESDNYITFHKSSIPGVFIRPQDVDGDFEIIWFRDSHKHEKDDETAYIKASTFIPDTNPLPQTREISTKNTKGKTINHGIQIPGLYIINAELEGRLSIAWEADSSTHLEVKFQIVSGLAEKKKFDGSNYDLLPGLAFAGEHELGPQPAEGRMKAFNPIAVPGEHTLKGKADAVKTTKPLPGVPVAKGIATDEEMEGEPEPDPELFLYGRMSRSSNAKLALDIQPPELRFITENTFHNNKSFTFNSDSVVQMYPFKKGYTFRIVNCGVVSNHGYQDHELHAFYPETNDFHHENYEGYEDTKKYPVWDAGKAAHNLTAWEEFTAVLQGLLGDKFMALKEKSDVGVAVKKGVAK
ncbi:hypothetical protein BDV96DRAFT_650937 [Lophiotrema nucula]|uniref:Uncharacterized protein n=1 Tax=Lophiotrema nucula TaxID=690887 RepID=A0A6A5YTE1_9PLEO|nr:hypothetical protein BDV96DRAFT_650937 [Lophiotrema nucula]